MLQNDGLRIYDEDTADEIGAYTKNWPNFLALQQKTGIGEDGLHEDCIW